MPTIDQVIALIGAGYTKDEIAAMMTPAPMPDPAPAPAPAPTPDPVPAPAPDDLNQQMWETMRNMAEMQKNMLALQQRQQTHLADGGTPPKPANVDDFLASIINPPTKN